jgi:hypothetical protein
LLPEPVAPVAKQESSRLSTAEKVALFRRLFRGRTDIYPIRWASKTTGKTGYARPVAMSGLPVFARSRASNVGNAITVC